MLVNQKELTVIHELFFSRQNFVTYAVDTEGVKQREQTIELGLRAGPERATSNLLHEISHFIEISVSRLRSHQWGLRFTKSVEVLGQIYYEPETTQACEREARVFAIQKVLSSYLNIPFDEHEAAHLIVSYVEGSFMLTGKNKEERKKRLSSHIAMLSKNYQADNLIAEFFHRVELAKSMPVKNELS